jgi:hypothetical protein
MTDPDERLFRRRMDALLISLDPKEARALYDEFMAPRHGPPLREDVPLAAVHKARMHWPKSTDAMKALSLAWLAGHGYETSIYDYKPAETINLNKLPIIRRQ